MDTESDIQRRKGLTIGTMKTLESQFNSRKRSIETKVRIFNAYVRCIFLYNSEIWITTNKINEQFSQKITKKDDGYKMAKNNEKH